MGKLFAIPGPITSTGSPANLLLRTACSFTRIIPALPASTSEATPLSPSTLLDFELLHNFTVNTSSTITSSLVVPSEEMREFYRTVFVHEAFSYDYFIHSLLALSGFHLVR